MTTKPRGGKRAGAGAPCKHGEPTLPLSVRLPLSFMTKLDSYQGNTRSERLITALKSVFGA